MNIKLNADDRMVEVRIGERKEYKSRVMLEIMFDVYTNGRTEEEAGEASEDMVEDIVRYLLMQLQTADGLPDPSECWASTYGVRNIDIEERNDE